MSSVIIIGALLVAQLTVTSRFSEARLDRRTKGEQVLVDAASHFQNVTFNELFDICEAKNAIAGPVTGVCLKDGAINMTSETEFDPADPSRYLELRRDWNGDVSSTGTNCVELNRCNILAEGHILDVTLMGYWPDPNPAAPPIRRPFTFRKARW